VILDRTLILDLTLTLILTLTALTLTRCVQAHQLVEEYPAAAVSWYAVGCYYHMISDFENARRYFSKATTIDHRFAPAWVGFGHAFAAQDESDQAMAAYRTASRLFPGSHIPWLGIGMEYLRTNHLHLALQYIRQAQEISPVEPLVLHELVCPQATHNRRVPRHTADTQPRMPDTPLPRRPPTRRSRRTARGARRRTRFAGSAALPEQRVRRRDLLLSTGRRELHRVRRDCACAPPSRVARGALLSPPFVRRRTRPRTMAVQVREPAIFNLGHAYRKKRDFDNAATCARPRRVNPPHPAAHRTHT
jgi:tetratricopeptide (TPR) repeat protein